MPTCAVCADALASTAALACSDCGEDFCRDHYHSHDCAPSVETEQEEDSHSQGAGNGFSARTAVAGLGYAAALLLGFIGVDYLARESDALLHGAEGVNAIQALIHLGASAAFFAFGTFVLIGAYIVSQG